MDGSGSLLIGIDIGTRSVRAGLFTPTGELVGISSRKTNIYQPQAGWAEQDPEEVWSALVTGVRSCFELADAAMSADRVAGIALGGTAVTMVVCDEDHIPLIPALLWMDTRASAEAEEISSFDSPWLRYTGGEVSPEWMLPKALWLKRHRTTIYAKSTRIVELVDWIAHRLTGLWTASLCTMSAEWSYVSHLGGWPRCLLEAIELDDLVDRLPSEIIPPGTQAGVLTASGEEALGLAAGIPVAQGLMDSYAAALGLNIFRKGRVVLSLGTSSAYITLADFPHFDRALLGPVPNAFGEGKFTLQGGQTSAGAIVKWFREQVTPHSSYADLDAGAATILPGAEGLMALDCWQGSRSPYRDPLARGAMWGLHLRHTAYHIYRALLESVAFGGRQILERMRGLGVNTDELWACGGGTQSPLWMQIHADVLGIPVVVATEANAAMKGAAVCAAVGAELHPDLVRAAEAMSHEGERVEPDGETHSIYSSLYEIYRRGYPALRESFQHLARLAREVHDLDAKSS